MVPHRPAELTAMGAWEEVELDELRLLGGWDGICSAADMGDLLLRRREARHAVTGWSSYGRPWRPLWTWLGRAGADSPELTKGATVALLGRRGRRSSASHAVNNERRRWGSRAGRKQKK
jgi:hypothetical protein